MHLLPLLFAVFSLQVYGDFPSNRLPEVQSILQSKCASCHSPGKNADAERSLANVLNPEGMQRRRRAVRSAIQDNAMPPSPASALTNSEKDLLLEWLDAGAPLFRGNLATPRTFITHEMVEDWIRRDLNRPSGEYMRYVTLHHLYNGGTPDADLDVFRQALAKMINSLSWNDEMFIPQAIDPNRLVYRLDLQKLGWWKEDWEKLAEEYPYDLRRTGEVDSLNTQSTKTRFYVLYIDWFIKTVSLPPHYHTFLELPSQELELETKLGVPHLDPLTQAQSGIFRAGFQRSEVSRNNRIIQRSSIVWGNSRYGSYWKSFDFSSSSGSKNILDFPLGPSGIFSRSVSFEHDGGEIIFSLPNNLQGYLLVNKGGSRIDKAPVEIVSDRSQEDPAITNGLSCISCHYQGMRENSRMRENIIDEVNRYWDESQLPHARTVTSLYPGSSNIRELLDQDRLRFEEALERLGISKVSSPSEEPVRRVVTAYDGDIGRTQAAAALGLTFDELSSRLRRLTELGTLQPLFISPAQSVRRELFETNFRVLARYIYADELAQVQEERARERERQEVEAARERERQEAEARARAVADQERLRQIEATRRRNASLLENCQNGCSTTRYSCLQDCERWRGVNRGITIQICQRVCVHEFSDCNTTCVNRYRN